LPLTSITPARQSISTSSIRAISTARNPRRTINSKIA
jgi:hypothetical protein